MTLRQVGAIGECGSLCGRLLSKDSIYWDFHVYLSLNNLCLLKEENTPIAMNTNSFQFPWSLNCSFWYTVVLLDVAR
jgi:hypothetical protein